MAKKTTKGGKTNKSGSSNTDVDMYMEIFAWSFKKQQKDYDRIVALQQSYDNTILDSVWPTTSKVPIAAFFESVEKALPLALDYIFSPSNRIRLMPTEPEVTMDQVRKTEMALWNLITYKMKLQRASIPTIKDVLKCGVGFGIIEPIFVSPPSSFGLTVEEGNVEKTTRVMDVGQSVQALRFRYVVPSQIVVTPDGSDFNGENPVSMAYFFDSYNENQFKDMYNESVLDGENPEMLGSPDEIIAEARDTGFTSETSIEDLIKKMSGISPSKLRPDSDLVPCRVPVLKVYDRYRRRHLWIANGTTIIYDKSDEFQTLRCPLVKASAWMDGVRFYPMSTPEAFQRIGWTKNIVINMFLDMLTMNLKRPIVYNSEMFDKEPSFGPNDKIRTSAPDARMGAAFMEGPKVDPASLTFYEYVNQLGNNITGQKDYMEKNFTRGGGMAFQDLMSTTEGMDRLKGAILEMTFFESAANQALIHLQTTVPDQGVVIRERKRDKVTGEDDITDLTVTENDICHGYELSVDLSAKKRMGAMEQNSSLAIYDRKKQSPFFDQWEVAADHLCTSDEEVRRQLKSREEVMALQKQQQQLAAQEQASKVVSNLSGGGGGGAGEVGGAEEVLPEQVAPQTSETAPVGI